MITNFNDLFAELKAQGICKKMVAAWGVDSHTIEAASLASDMGFVKVTLVGDTDLIAKVCSECKIDMGKFEIVNGCCKSVGNPGYGAVFIFVFLGLLSQ